jgi:hypothetical protein
VHGIVQRPQGNRHGRTLFDKLFVIRGKIEELQAVDQPDRCHASPGRGQMRI